MIFGKSYEEKNKIKQARLKSQLGRLPFFTIIPRQLNNGKWVWFQTVYRNVGVRTHSSPGEKCRYFYGTIPIYYLTKDTYE